MLTCYMHMHMHMHMHIHMHMCMFVISLYDSFLQVYRFFWKLLKKTNGA
jgi:hypothetical protein